MAFDSSYLANVSFLIVEPNNFMRSVVRNILKAFGAQKVKEAADGADAFKNMQSTVPDIILTEWVMEPIDGIDFTRLVRTAGDTPNPYIPIILMTAYSEWHRVIEARESGITEFIVKPLSAKTLLVHIAEVIERPRPFVKTGTYFGPDRRRRRKGDFRGDEKRGQGPKVDRNASLDQEKIDSLIAGEKLGG